MDVYAALMRKMSLASCHLGEGDIFDSSQTSVHTSQHVFLCEQTLVFLALCLSRSTVVVSGEMSRRSLKGMYI